MTAQVKVKRLGNFQYSITETIATNLYYEWFQSYDVLVGKKSYFNGVLMNTYLDPTYWDYSKTTGKYRSIFLGEKKKETETNLKEGKYKLINLN
tara:strand:+ start:147 stop:428 length:282 start_codon:yes stop_codon:yes gene_type:complete